MTSTLVTRPTPRARSVRPRHYLMCPPTFFDVAYRINPWMDPTVPVDRARALAQWSTLVEAYRAAGHRVELLDPVDGLPDMVFAANGATVVDGRVLPARFASTQRGAEAALVCARHTLEKVAALNRRLASELAEPLVVGIGIHTGPAIVGRMGPPKTPLLSALGDTVNAAARLETATKELGAPVVVSRDTLEAAGLAVSSVTVARPSLDDVYLRHTGRSYTAEPVLEGASR
jgi:class 3 adenylate cyclase